MVFQKSPQITGELSDEQMALASDDVDGSGRSLIQQAGDIFDDAIQTAWGGLLVDYPNAEGITNQAEGRGLKSFQKWYPAESVLDCRYDTVNGAIKLVMVRLKEIAEAPNPIDRFIMKQEQRVRVLELADGIYQQSIYSERNDFRAPISEPIVPKMNGAPLDFIPFIPCPADKPEKSIIVGVADENINFYQLSGDYRNGLQVEGVPTLFIIGARPQVDPDTGKTIPVHLGPTANYIWSDGDTGSGSIDVRWVSLQGGLEDLRLALADSKDRMAVLGSMILSNISNASETATAARIYHSGENSTLAGLSKSVGECITKACRIRLEWDGVPPEAAETFKIELNSDFDTNRLGSADLQALVSAWQNGAISKRDLWKNLSQGELVEAGLTYEEYEAAIETEGAGSRSIPALDN